MSYRYRLADFLAQSILISFALTVVLCALGFFLHIKVGAWQFPLSLIAGIAISARLNKPAASSSFSVKAFTIRYLLPLFLIIAASLLFAGYFYDVSFDGQAYHQEAIILLRNGWNPVFSYQPDGYMQIIWVNHYVLGIELLESCIYATFGHIEMAKACNLLLFFASFCTAFGFLGRFRRHLSHRIIFICAFLLAANPIVINQLISFYIDGCMASLLLCLLIQLIAFIAFKQQWASSVAILSIVPLLINLKFSSMVYALFFGFFALVWIFFYCRTFSWRFIGIYGVAVILGFIVGFHPYYTNFRDFQHPLYPLMGKNKKDIMSYNLPKGFDGMPEVQKLLISLFSRTENLDWRKDQTPELKVPFTFDKDDFINAPKVDTRVAGFGPMFGGVLILSCILLGVYFRSHVRKKEYRHIAYISLVLLCSLLIMPQSWWARYVPQLWLFPMVLVIFFATVSRDRIIRGVSLIICLALCFNLCFNVVSIPWNLAMTAHVKYQLYKLKRSGEVIDVSWGNAKSNRVRFQEYGLPYRSTKFKDTTNLTNIVRSDTYFYKPKGYAVDIDEPLLVKWTKNIIQNVEL